MVQRREFGARESVWLNQVDLPHLGPNGDPDGMDSLPSGPSDPTALFPSGATFRPIKTGLAPVTPLAPVKNEQVGEDGAAGADERE